MILVTLFGLVTFILIGWGIYKLFLANKGLTLGQTLAKMLDKQHLSLVMVFTLFLLITEAGIAASMVNSVENTKMNPFFRYMGHLIPALIGFFLTFRLPGYINMTRKKYKNPGFWIAFFLAFIGSIGAPILNLIIIAVLSGTYNGINQVELLSIFLKTMNLHYYSAMEPTLMISTMMVLFHIVLQLYDAFASSIDVKVKYQEGEIDKKINDKDDSPPANFQSVILYLLRRVGYDDEKANNYWKNLEKKLQEINSAQASATISVAATKLRQNYVDAYKIVNALDKDKKLKELDTQLFDFAKRSPNHPEGGLGSPLKAR